MTTRPIEATRNRVVATCDLHDTERSPDALAAAMALEQTVEVPQVPDGAEAERTTGARCAAGAGRNSARRGQAQSAAAAGSSALSTITGVSKYEIRGSAP